MEKKGFFERLLDSKDRSIDQTIFFTFIGLVSIVTCALLWVVLDPKDFSISSFGGALGFLFGGSGASAIGHGMQSGMSKE